MAQRPKMTADWTGARRGVLLLAISLIAAMVLPHRLHAGDIRLGDLKIARSGSALLAILTDPVAAVRGRADVLQTELDALEANLETVRQALKNL